MTGIITASKPAAVQAASRAYLSNAQLTKSNPTILLL